MGNKKSEIGPSGNIAAERLRAIRTRRQMSLRELSERVTALGHPLTLAMINRIELGLRAMRVDDLTALAAALGVTPPALLMPTTVSDSEPVLVTGAEGDAEQIWDWLRGKRQVPSSDVDWRTFVLNNEPVWTLSAKQALEEQAEPPASLDEALAQFGADMNAFHADARRKIEKLRREHQEGGN